MTNEDESMRVLGLLASGPLPVQVALRLDGASSRLSKHCAH